VPIGAARRRELSLELLSPDPELVVGVISRASKRDLVSNSLAFAATMHLGFAGSREYHLMVEHRPAEEPLATLLSLTPVIAAYAY
jgi:hypothetical protein